MKLTSNNSRTVRDIGEFGLISQLARIVKTRDIIVGIGDDCAVLPSGDRKKYLLYTCDPSSRASTFYEHATASRWLESHGAETSATSPPWAACPAGLSDIGLRPSTRVRSSNNSTPACNPPPQVRLRNRRRRHHPRETRAVHRRRPHR